MMSPGIKLKSDMFIGTKLKVILFVGTKIKSEILIGAKTKNITKILSKKIAYFWKSKIKSDIFTKYI